MGTEQRARIHPLVAGAAVAVIIASLVGVAAMTGHLPGSSAGKAPEAQIPVSTTPSAATPPEKTVHNPATQASAHKKQVVAAAPSTPVVQTPPVCADCGVVVEVKEVEVKGQGTGLGAVAGGLAGAVVGSQIGEGRGKVLAEVAGAAGGAYAGHQIEKNVRSHKRYEVSVRMDDGSTKSVSYETQPTWHSGDKVRLVNDKLEPRN